MNPPIIEALPSFWTKANSIDQHSSMGYLFSSSLATLVVINKFARLPQKQQTISTARFNTMEFRSTQVSGTWTSSLSTSMRILRHFTARPFSTRLST